MNSIRIMVPQIFLFLFISIGISMAADRVDDIPLENRLKGGAEVPNGKYKFMVAVVYKGKENTLGVNGVVVGKYHVLVSYYGVQNYLTKMDQLIVKSGVSDLTPGSVGGTDHLVNQIAISYKQYLAILKKLAEIQNELLDETTCLSKYTDPSFDKNNLMCIVPTTTASVCYGDSGAAVVVDGVLAAISRFFTCGGGALPDVGVKISAFTDWIKQTIVATTL